MGEQAILEFYNGEMEHPDTGLYIEDVIRSDDDFWESCHGFIQWVFPSDEVSKYNPTAPLLTFYTAQLLDKRIMLQCFDRFVNFLGINAQEFGGYNLAYTNPASKRTASHRPHRVAEWLENGNHNLLRISRVLRCLTLCGLNHQAQEFYNFLIDELHAPAHISKTTLDFWNLALRACPDVA